MPKFTLDGKEIEFRQGQTIIEAAADAGITIPHFCWHPALSVSGNCRMCLVEVAKMPKLAIACATKAADGMEVFMNSEKALDARNAVMEFLLINHPLDCPICDEAGECKLQEYAYKHSVGESSFSETKVHKKKRVDLGPHIMFDQERCISCSRCIRFTDEYAGEKQLTFVKRGVNVTIETYPGKRLDNPYSMNVIDICPVGALTSKDFRFQARAWDMAATKSVCTGCARGCNIDIWTRSNKILRLTPRENMKVNEHWMCDHGRLNTFKFVNDEKRIDGPHVRRDGELKQVNWAEAFSTAGPELKSYSGNEIACLGSAFATLEDNYMLAKFARTIINTGNIDFADHTEPGSGDDKLIRDDKAPNAEGARLAGVKPGNNGLDFQAIMKAIDNGKIRALYLLEDDIAGMSEEYEKILSKLDLLVVHAHTMNKTAQLAHIVLPASTYAEKFGTWINFAGHLQRIRPAVTTLEFDRSLDGVSRSRLDKFGTEYDRWGKVRRIDARPSWKIVSGLCASMDKKMKYQMAEDVFEEMAKTIDVLKNIDYDDIGDTGIALELQSVNV